MRALKIFLYGIAFIFILLMSTAIIKYTSPPTISQSSSYKGPSNTNVENDLKNLAVKFINAEYKGDTKALLDMSKLQANEAIKNGEHSLPTDNKLEKIISYNFIHTEKENTWEVIVAISDSTRAGGVQPTYYEHLWFEKIENKWYVVKIERDA